MITIKEYKNRVKENTIEYKRQLVAKEFDLLKFHGIDAIAGSLGRFILAKKTHDILGAVLLGILPYLKENTGADAVKLNNGVFEEIEIKTSYASILNFFKTENDIVYSTKNLNLWPNEIPKDNVTSLHSCFNASYSIINNLSSKMRDTYLIAIDERDDSVIDAYMMGSNDMMVYFSGRKNEIPKSGKITIKLSTFMKCGKSINTIVDKIGIYEWKNSLLPSLSTKNVDHRRKKK